MTDFVKVMLLLIPVNDVKQGNAVCAGNIRLSNIEAEAITHVP